MSACPLPNRLAYKRGFNLIEIAIVLAVIGLVIGGIYTAASAVTENRRRQQFQEDLIKIVHNVRILYAYQTEFVAPDAPTTRTLQIFPPNMFYANNTYINVYGGVTYLETAANRQTFGIHFLNIPKSACTYLLTTMFGSGTANQQILLKTAHVQSVDVHDAHPNGLTPAQAVTLCDSDSNQMVFDYWLR